MSGTQQETIELTNPVAEFAAALAKLNAGEATTAIIDIGKVIKLSLSQSKPPDPVEWAYYIVGLFCQGDMLHSVQYAAKFAELRHIELDRARWLAKVLKSADATIPPPDESGQSQSIHEVPVRTHGQWVEYVKSLFAHCSQDYFVKILDGGKIVSADKDRSLNTGGIVTMYNLGNFGRFANQVFQYAFLKILARARGMTAQIPFWIGRKLFACDDPIPDRVLPMFNEDVKAGKTAEYYLKSDEISGGANFCGNFIEGFAQFASSHKDYFRSLFVPADSLRRDLNAVMAAIRSRGKTIVAVHVRRGDYGHNPDFPAVPVQWHLDWLGENWAKFDSPVLFVASDEPDKVIPYFRQYEPICGDDLGLKMPQTSFYPDFYVLSQADVLVTANSSYSYAAALLNERATKFYKPSFTAGQIVEFDPWSPQVAETIPPAKKIVADEASSIARIVPHIMHLCQPRSIVQVGCGDGAWLAEFQRCGVSDCVGMDWRVLDESQLKIPRQMIQPIDPSAPIKAGRTFDVAIVVDMVQHVPPINYAAFLQSLTGLSSVIVFAAPVPYQTHNRGNFQCWPSFWREMFLKYSFMPYDCLRRRFWSDPQVDPYIAQNILIYAYANMLERYPVLAGQKPVSDPWDMDVVHPKILADAMRSSGCGKTAADTPGDYEKY